MTGLYWIAVNGSSCARFSLPLREPFVVKPTPEILIGFQTHDEAEEGQAFLLTAPVENVRERMAQWMRHADVKIVHPPNPEPQTDGETMWMEV